MIDPLSPNPNPNLIFTFGSSFLSFFVETKKKEDTGQKDPNLRRTLGPLGQNPVLLQNQRLPEHIHKELLRSQQVQRITSIALL